jgi:hypothetical protein
MPRCRTFADRILIVTRVVINIKNLRGNYDVFICYETTTALDFAKNLKMSLKKLNMHAFVAKEDIPPGIDEREYRYSVIRDASKFILIMTVLGLESEEMQNETKEALNYEKDLIPCIHEDVDQNELKRTFPEVGKKQWIEFQNGSELANKVTSSIRDSSLLEEKINLERRNSIRESLGSSLAIEPEWSLKKISQYNNIGHIVFKLKNLSCKRIFIYGYKIFRVSPNGETDVYYYKKISDAQNFNRWVSDQHFKMILYKNDEHIFHWDDVNIMDVYGINKIGKWLTEVQIVYIEEGCNDHFYSIGTAEIEFE